MNINYSTYTDIGDRKKNEDCFLAGETKTGLYFGVADGLGGHGKGDVASHLVCHVADQLLQVQDSFRADTFPHIFSACQEALFRKQSECQAVGQMRTTLNLLCIEPQQAIAAHIGDGRTYYFNKKKLISRSFDHSVPQMLVAVGQLTEGEIRFHEDRSRLLKVLGTGEANPPYEIDFQIPLMGDQQFLLCSDGFWEFITEEQMLICLDEADTPGMWLENMLELLRKNGRHHKMDNLTAITVWIYSKEDER
ncbi:MAG: PP2C family protein-serine/threonine phosphatase [Fusicatenibacter sp.]